MLLRTLIKQGISVWGMVFAFQRALIVVKWSKTLQDWVTTTTVDMPYLGASALCPIAALERMLATHPSHPDSPLFQIPQADPLQIRLLENIFSRCPYFWAYIGP